MTGSVRAEAATTAAAPGTKVSTVRPPGAPLYWRALALRNVRPNGVVRVMLVEGLLVVGVLL